MIPHRQDPSDLPLETSAIIAANSQEKNLACLEKYALVNQPCSGLFETFGPLTKELKIAVALIKSLVHESQI